MEENNNNLQAEQCNLHIVRRCLWLRFSDWVAKSADKEECERNKTYGLCDNYTKNSDNNVKTG